MTNEQIEKFVLQKYLDKSAVTINFKARQSIKGLFIKTADYAELKSKNLWRIVNGASIEEYNKSKDVNLARIFNGVEITRLGIA
ncbi:MAG: short-chain dehydrogenase [Chitinophagaceae bacterium]|nr:short-chain dehydrogenase [Chitinophagaceae bacterium]MBK9570989.1 short-chain dehydrogenase [Chitinophagaceae bacterium]MBL0273388.1 short-chain dehydrogenase [Chitinophagaceae bacterium]